MKTTFRAILDQFLEESELAAPPKPKASNGYFSSEKGFFEPGWRPNFSQKRAGLDRAYPARIRRSAFQAATVVSNTEVSVSLENLPPFELACVKILIDLGADNLTQSLSESGLRKAHRRLAKTIHPDRLPKNSPAIAVSAANEKFMKLTKAYKSLRAYLKAYKPPEQRAAA